MRIQVDVRGIDPAAVDYAMGFAINALSQQALTDCNYYCKQDTGALIQSSLIHPDTDNATLTWAMPYAEKQYFMTATRLDKNPNAGPEWCAKAEANHGQEWQAVFTEALKRGGL